MGAARQLPAGVDVAEVIDLACPSLAAQLVANLRPPYGIGLFDDAQGALVGVLLLARAVALAGDVLLVNNPVHPDLPVAAADVTQQRDRLTCRDHDMRCADGYRTRCRRAA